MRDTVALGLGAMVLAGAVTVLVVDARQGGCGSVSAASGVSAIAPAPSPVKLNERTFRWIEVDRVVRGPHTDFTVALRFTNPRSLRPAGVPAPTEGSAARTYASAIGDKGPLLLALSEGGSIITAVDLDGEGGVRVLGGCEAIEVSGLRRAAEATGLTPEAALRSVIADPTGPAGRVYDPDYRAAPGKPYSSQLPSQRQLDLLDLTVPPAAFQGLQTLTVHLELPPRLGGFSTRLCGRLPEAWVQCAELTSDGTYAFWHRGEVLSLWLDGGGDRRTYGQLIAFTPDQLARGTVMLRLVDGLPLSQLTLRAVTGGPALQVVG